MAQDPQTIGRYRVIRALGSGGMGVVYLAEDPLLKRRVAVKVVRGGGGLEQGQALARFHREAEVSARLSHPNVITVYDVGEEPGLGPFMTMEYVEGASLADLVRGAGLDVETRLRALVQTKRALAAAHDAGIVHRDVKPANLMLGRDGRIRLMDFGIARADEAMLTATGMVLGTPSYIAPEQLNGAEPSPGTDRYAFFVVAFELFAGRPPFAANATSAILYKIAHEPPEIPEGFSPKLRDVFLRALTKDPAGRFESFDSFLRALLDAVDLDRAGRGRITALLDEDGSPPESSPTEPAAAPRPAAGPNYQPGLSLGQILAFAGALGMAVAALGGFVYWSVRPAPDAGKTEIAALPTPAASEPAPAPPEPAEVPRASAPAPVQAGPDPGDLLARARNRIVGAELAGVQVVAVAEGTAFLRGETKARDVESIETLLRDVEGIERVDTSGLRIWPTSEVALPRIRDELRANGLSHVEATLGADGDIRLTGLASDSEAARARELALAVTGQDARIVTAVRAPAPVARRAPERAVAPAPRVSARPTPAPPVWGDIRHEGARQTE